MMNTNKNKTDIITAAAVDLYPTKAEIITAAAADLITADITAAAAAVARIAAAADLFAACLSDYAGLSHNTDIFNVAYYDEITAAAAAAAVARIAAAAAAVSDFITVHCMYCDDEEISAAAESARIAAAYMDGYGIFTDEWKQTAAAAAAAVEWIVDSLED